MIVVLGSRHDPVAAALLERWPDAALCSAEDLTTPGWIWSAPLGDRTWVVSGQTVVDEEVTGVFVRRSSVLPAELLGIHPEDRAYVAAEVQAFLVYVLATTGATVAAPVRDGGLGDEALRPELWMPAATIAGLGVVPLRLGRAAQGRRALRTRSVEVVGDEVVGDAGRRTAASVRALAAELDLPWAAFVLDGRHRLVTMSTTAGPSEGAAARLGPLLGRRV